MSVRCPYCQHLIELKGAHPGRFTPKCPQCQHRFILVIAEDANIPPLVGEMPAASQGSMSGATHAQRTVTQSAQTQTTGAGTAAASQVRRQAQPASATLPPPATATVPPAPPAAPSPRTEVGLAGSPGDLPPSPRTIAKETIIEHGPSLTGQTLGGYQVMQKLGEGGMGAVYLARQVSLDRNVALKVLSPQLAADPQFVARFTREAYAAAQLSHHNVVQIHDIGVDNDTNFFSMEFVPGQTLEKVVKHDGKLDPEVAVGYVLQAARGLRFAHEHGLVHRDVKPDNLLLNEDGIVKVADLGLVKQAGAEDITGKQQRGAGPSRPGSSAVDASKTQLNISMGTPAYMPPEQARDAAHVDQRADIYSLGCTLYDLLTGRPPFSGNTAVEIITKHQKDAIVPPDRVTKHVSPELSHIAMKMMAKRPEERYQTMGEVVEALEAVLGVESGKPFSPKEEHVRVLEGSVESFHNAKWAKLRKTLVLGFFGVSIAGAVICALPQVGKPFWAAAFAGFAVLTTLFYQVMVGVTRKTHLFTRVRQFAFGARLVDWLKFLAALAVFILLLVLFSLHWPWLTAAVFAAGVAAAFHFTVDRLSDNDRKLPLAHIEDMLKTMRLRGLDEAALRQFVCKYSGERWEEMYESLFGYEAKRAARKSWGKSERGRDRKKFGAWRDLIIDWIDARTLARKEQRERRMLAKIEAKALAAKGLDQASANRKAKQAADRLMHKASQVKQEADRRAMMTALPTRTSSGRSMAFDGAKPLTSWADGFVDAPDDKHNRHGKDDERVHESYFKRRFGTPMDFVLGPQVRILVGAVLIGFFALWIKQNGGIEYSNTANFEPEKIVQGKNLQDLKASASELKNKVEIRVKGKQVVYVPMVPEWVCAIVGSNYNGGIAGALLLLTGFFAGKRLGAMVLLGSAIILLAYRVNVPFFQDRAWAAAGVGLAVAVLGVVMFRRAAADS